MDGEYSDLVIDRVTGPDGSSALLTLRGILDISTADAFRRTLTAIQAATIEVRLAELVFLDSSGLAALLATRRHAAVRGQELRFSGATGEVRDVLERTGTLALIEG